MVLYCVEFETTFSNVSKNLLKTFKTCEIVSQLFQKLPVLMKPSFSPYFVCFLFSARNHRALRLPARGVQSENQRRLHPHHLQDTEQKEVPRPAPTRPGINMLELFGSRQKFFGLVHHLQTTQFTYTTKRVFFAAFVLHDAGYDVWLSNYRGNQYSEEHVNLTVHDKEFWDHRYANCSRLRK